jgi:hypothetical protein
MLRAPFLPCLLLSCIFRLAYFGLAISCVQCRIQMLHLRFTPGRRELSRP